MKRLKEVFEQRKKTKIAEEDTEINRKVRKITKKFGGCIEKEVLSEKESIGKKEMVVKDKIRELERKEKEVKLKKSPDLTEIHRIYTCAGIRRVTDKPTYGGEQKSGNTKKDLKIGKFASVSKKTPKLNNLENIGTKIGP